MPASLLKCVYWISDSLQDPIETKQTHRGLPAKRHSHTDEPTCPCRLLLRNKARTLSLELVLELFQHIDHASHRRLVVSRAGGRLVLCCRRKPRDGRGRRQQSSHDLLLQQIGERAQRARPLAKNTTHDINFLRFRKC